MWYARSAGAATPDLFARDFARVQVQSVVGRGLHHLCCWEGLVFFSFVIDAFSLRIIVWQFVKPAFRGTRPGFTGWGRLRRPQSRLEPYITKLSS